MYEPHPADSYFVVGRGSISSLALLPKLGLLPLRRSWPCTGDRSHALFAPHGIALWPYFKRRLIECGHLRRHETVVCFERVCPAVRLGEKGSIGSPLNVYCFSHYKDVLRGNLQPARSTF
jgi:hypothetical protein